MSEAVTVAGGTPTLTLNDGGTATYVSGSGTNALTFSYTVARRPEHRRPGGDGGQPQRRYDHQRRRHGGEPVAERPDQSGPQIDTYDADHHGDSRDSPASGDLGVGKTVTLTLNSARP